MSGGLRTVARIDSLVVEGPDDGSVVNALVKARFDLDLSKRNARIVNPAGGVTEAVDAFSAALKMLQKGQRLGLLVDRDGVDGKPDRWNAVRAILTQRGYAPPEQPAPGGWLHTTDSGARIGVWLMPDNEHMGDLETFLNQLITPDHPLWSHAQQATDHAPASPDRFAAKDHRKAVLHAWTAWLDEPGGGYGLAIKRGHLPAEHPVAAPFVEWLRRLFLEA